MIKRKSAIPVTRTTNQYGNLIGTNVIKQLFETGPLLPFLASVACLNYY